VSEQDPNPKPVTSFGEGVLRYFGDDPETLLKTTAELNEAFEGFGRKLAEIGVEHKLEFEVNILVSTLDEDE
jgi:hypothetical protein